MVPFLYGVGFTTGVGELIVVLERIVVEGFVCIVVGVELDAARRVVVWVGTMLVTTNG